MKAEKTKVIPWEKILRSLIVVLIVMAVSAFLTVWSPVSFDLISTGNYSSLNMHILWSGAFIIFLRAVVFIFTLFVILQIVTSEE